MNRSSIVSASVPLCLFIAGFSVALSAVAVDRNNESPNFAAADSPADNVRGYIPEDWKRDSWTFPSPDVEIQSVKGRELDRAFDKLIAAVFRLLPRNRKTMESMDQNTSGNKIEDNVEDVRANEIGKTDDAAAQGNCKSVNPQLESRTIIDPPGFQCPPGQQMDPTGKCRPIIT